MTKFKTIVLLTMLGLTLCACEDKKEVVQNDKKVETGANYKLDNTFNLPQDDMAEEDKLNCADLELNLEGKLAMYRMIKASDDDNNPEIYIETNYLSNDGSWSEGKICRKALSKLRKKFKKYRCNMKSITRGDDGNLYGLLKFYSIDENSMKGMFIDPNALDNDENSTYEDYHVVTLNEADDSIIDVKLDTGSSEKDSTDHGNFAVIRQFHIYEDGTILLANENGKAFFFDGQSGHMQNQSDVPNNAMSRSLAFGENEFLTYSATDKVFKLLDGTDFNSIAELGKDIPEEERSKDWFYDTNTDTWSLYAFNGTGLYRVDNFGKSAKLDKISLGQQFNDLETQSAVIYDILVDKDENIYVLNRTKPTGDDAFDPYAWNFNINFYKRAENSK